MVYDSFENAFNIALLICQFLYSPPIFARSIVDGIFHVLVGAI